MQRGPYRSLPRVARGGNPDSDPHTSMMRPQTGMKYFQTATRSAIDVALLGNFDAGDIPLSTRRVK
jgi:hypothetical protein